MAQQQIPFLHAPFKRTDDVDWILPLKRYISQVYQDDAEKYNEETFTLNRLRQDIRGAGKDLTGRDLLYRYFGQLELLDLRFPVDEKHIKILFTWYDAFNGRPTSQYSLAYEKASVIFNTAATLSAIAAIQNRAEAEGRKRAFNYFQAAAGMFQYINDNFLHAPSQDLHRDTVKMLTELMLAQAHECFLENSLREKKKDGLIGKLVSHAAWVYGSLIDDIQECIARGVGVERAWLLVCQVKHKYYQALAQQHRAAACEQDNAYGEQVARLSAGETAAKEAGKIANGGGWSALVQSSTTMPADTVSVLQESCKALAASLAEKHTMAARDNDMIYHDNVPKESILTPIDRLKAVKTVPISELYGPNEASRVIGGDIFSRLIPLSVHESASMYSEEKAKLVRAEADRCDLAKAELNASLEYMRLPRSLDKFKQPQQHGAKADSAILDTFAVPLPEAREWADKIAQEESTSNSTTLHELIQTLGGLKSRASQMLDQTSLSLDQEMRECESMRAKYGADWSQEPSGAYTGDFRQDLRNHRESLSSASQSDTQLLHAYEVVSKDVDILKQGGKSNALEAVFAEKMVNLFAEKSSSKADSLLDLEFDVGIASKSMDVKVKRVEDALDKLRKIEIERQETLQDLKEKAMQDDISQLLVLNKKTVNVEQQIFTTELEKFRPHQQRIATSIHQQQQGIQELTAAFKALMEGEDAQKLQSRWDAAERQRRIVMDQLGQAHHRYFETKNGIRKGIEFYSSLCDVIESLTRNVNKFTAERGQERDKLVERIESSRSTKEQEMLKEKLSKYTTATTPSAPTVPQIDTSPSVTQLVDKTREMTLGGNNTNNVYGPQPTASPLTPSTYSTQSQPYSTTSAQPAPYTNFALPQQQQQQQQQPYPLPQSQPPPQPQQPQSETLQRAPSYSSNPAATSYPALSTSSYSYAQSSPVVPPPMPPKENFNRAPPPLQQTMPYPPNNMYGGNTTMPVPMSPSTPMMPQQQPAQPYSQRYQQPAVSMPTQSTPTSYSFPQQQQPQQPPPLPSKPPQMQTQPLSSPVTSTTPSYYPMLSSSAISGYRQPQQQQQQQPPPPPPPPLPQQPQPYMGASSHPPPPINAQPQQQPLSGAQPPLPAAPPQYQQMQQPPPAGYWQQQPQQQQQQQPYPTNMGQSYNTSNGGGSLLD